LRIAFVTSRVPYPVNIGGHIRTFNLLKQISQGCPVTLFTTVAGDRDGEAALGLRRTLPGLTVSTLRVAPRSSWRRRAARLLSSPVDPLPYTWAAYRDPRFTALLQERITPDRFDIVHCDHIQIAHLLAEVRAVPRLVNLHNVERILIQRVAAAQRSPWRRALVGWQARKVARAEMEVYRSFDSCVAVSETDKEAVAHVAPRLRVAVVPNGVDLEYFAPTPDAPVDPDMILFTGALDWLPNVDALDFVARDILPRIRRHLPAATLSVVGRHAPAALLRRFAHDGVTIASTVPDVRPYMERAALYLVPLRIGGGTRLKILEAWAMGKAVLSTTLGAEGLPAVDGRNIVIADTPDQIAGRAVGLLRDPAARRALGCAGQATVRGGFDWPVIAQRLLRIYQETMLDRTCRSHPRNDDGLLTTAELS
jgi:glycosyltransferase involved in cell wall biosynthesis